MRVPAKLGDVLSARRRRCFVGREAELELVRATLEAREPSFSVLWITGPGGIGKSRLLEAVAEQAEEGDALSVVRLDGRNPAPSPREIIDVLRGALGGSPGTGGEPSADRRLVLLIDAYERLSALDDWIRGSLLPGLPADTLTIVAAREPPSPEWRADPAWRGLLRVVSLRNFGPEESRGYLTACGVDPAAHERLVQVTHGHPLGLSLVADLVVAGGEAPIEPLAPDLVATLLRRFVDVVPIGERRSALEACALSRVTTEALIRDSLGLENAHDVFAWLRDRSFVETGPDGLFPHDLARDVLDADLRWRDPEGYKRLFRRVRGHVQAGLTSSRGRARQRAAFDLKFLFRNLPSVLSPVDWEAWGHSYPTAAEPGDHARILDLVHAAEGEVSAAIAERWLHRQPEGFLIVRDEDDDVRGLLGLLDLTAAGEQDRRADPGAEAAWQYAHGRAPPRPGETITQTRFVVDREGYQDPSPTLNAVPVATLLRYLETPRLAWDLLALHEPEPWDEYFALADLGRAPGADFVVGGRRYGLYAHDFRSVPVDALIELWTERALAQDASWRPAPTDEPIVLSQRDFDDAVRQGLRDLHRPELLARNPLLRTRLARRFAGTEPPDGELLGRLLLTGVDVLRRHPRDDKLLRAVNRTYVRPAPNQHAAADVLGLPFSTYRRHLSQGVRRLVACLWDHELYGTAPSTGEHH
ncbi:MAG: AAA family ATPase [Solirubrobacteraceae bacterium]|nr:AAA family ATPase [Solirubrobacteraceae bacterium]